MHEARIEHDLVDDQQHVDAGLHAVHLVDRVDFSVLHDGLQLAGWQHDHGQRGHDRHVPERRHELDGRDRHRLHVRQHVPQLDRHEQLDGIARDGRRVQLDQLERLDVVDDALMPLRYSAVALAIVASLGLAACHRGSPADEHATSSARAPKGATGAGSSDTAAMGGPGTGLNGGLAPSGSAGRPTAVASGSTNRTPRSSVGNR